MLVWGRVPFRGLMSLEWTRTEQLYRCPRFSEQSRPCWPAFGEVSFKKRAESWPCWSPGDGLDELTKSPCGHCSIYFGSVTSDRDEGSFDAQSVVRTYGH